MQTAVVWLDNRHTTDADRDQAAALAIPRVAVRPAAGFYLLRDESGLALQHADDSDRGRPVRPDLLAAGRERGVMKSPLAKACGLARRPDQSVLDTTAGLGRDTAALAALGARVQPIERQPALFALLHDAHCRALAPADTPRPAWIERLAPPVYADSAAWLEHAAGTRYDTIYIDPMFNSTRRKAKPQKALAWLAELAGPDTDVDTLLAVARRVAVTRVVVKQHARGEPLAPPDRQLDARAVRFDIYLTPKH